MWGLLEISALQVWSPEPDLTRLSQHDICYLALRTKKPLKYWSCLTNASSGLAAMPLESTWYKPKPTALTACCYSSVLH